MTNEEMEKAIISILEFTQPYAEKLYKLGYYRVEFGRYPTQSKFGKPCTLSLTNFNSSTCGMGIRLSNPAWCHSDNFFLKSGKLKNFSDEFHIHDYLRQTFIPLLSNWNSIKKEIIEFVSEKEQENDSLDSFKL